MRRDGVRIVELRYRLADGLLDVEQLGDPLLDDGGPEEAFEEPPETLQGTIRELIRGAYKLDHTLLLPLDVQGVVELPPRAGGSGIAPATPM